MVHCFQWSFPDGCLGDEVENSCAASYFYGKYDTLLLSNITFLYISKLLHAFYTLIGCFKHFNIDEHTGKTPGAPDGQSATVRDDPLRSES